MSGGRKDLILFSKVPKGNTRDPSVRAVCAQGTNSAHPFCLRHPDRFDDPLFAPILCLPQSGAESRRGCMNRHAGSCVDSTPFADVAAKYQYDEIPRGSTY